MLLFLFLLPQINARLSPRTTINAQALHPSLPSSEAVEPDHPALPTVVPFLFLNLPPSRLLPRMVLGHRKSSVTSNRSSVDEVRDSDDGGDETVVNSEQGSMLSHIIAQLRPGADLSRVTLPTFILEPKSMLERITNFMAHPETLLPVPTIDDPVQRFVAVTKFYLAGWHIKPPGVKKPLNPILGETFTGYWDYPDKTRAFYIAEQTSHHPPKSSYFFMAPEHHIRIDGTLKPRSKFLGNSVASFMEGIAVLRFSNRGER